MIEKELVYNIDEKLGLIYTKEKSIMKVWAPTQESLKLCLYDTYNDQSREEFYMKKDENGIFSITIDGDLEGKFYTYLVGNKEVTDPYSFSSSANSKRTAIIDLEKSNPEGFLNHKIPFNDKNKAIISEVHVADISIDKTSGAKYRGLFLGASETGTKYKTLSTGIDHFKEIGITHLHLLPLTDYLTVDETKPLKDFPKNFNWGYDQELYNNIEGSFSTNPNDPYSRIKEFKTLVQKYHENGISIVLDVVYNHTFRNFDSNFNTLVPNYYYRMSNGHFSNGSGCGNELASENPMVRKFIVESLCYLAKEYKIDGFRFDLMALTDIDTIMLAKEKLEEINPNILIYGEPWMALGTTLPYDKQINIGAQKNKGFSIFNPFFRDALKGDNDGDVKGYLQGKYYKKNEIESGIAGSISFNDIEGNFANPLESINYFNAHDNLIFNDKLIKSNVSKSDIPSLTYMAFSILMTSQGIPFFHAGNEFLRTKKMNHNSYNAPADINGIDWSLKKKNENINNRIKNLIHMRKELGIFNMKTGDEVRKSLSFIKNLKDYIIGYIIEKDSEKYMILHNVSSNTENIDLSKEFDYTNFEIIWEDEFKIKEVDEIILKPYSTVIYKIK